MAMEVLKTYKLYINGQFPRTESGRYMKVLDKEGKLLANVCRASRKDFRNAVVAAKAAQTGWEGRTAYNRAQILYRLAEMTEGRAAQFERELRKCGSSASAAKTDVRKAIDLMVYYAGWCDKYAQLISTVNPVSGPFFNFSFPEATGVVASFAEHQGSLYRAMTLILPPLVAGNAVIVCADEQAPLALLSFTEVVQNSDFPAGVLNILSGSQAELAPHFASHLEVDCILSDKLSKVFSENDMQAAAENVKRVVTLDLSGNRPYGLAYIRPFVEIKTTWHPVGV
jgi:acyl-CoA reductase-like NAD-dependent aldehyde dehydrogenase